MTAALKSKAKQNKTEKIHTSSELPPLKAHCLKSHRLFLAKGVMCYFTLSTEVNCTLKGAFFFGLFAFSRVAPAAHESSQATGPIRAVVAALHQSHSNAES